MSPAVWTNIPLTTSIFINVPNGEYTLTLEIRNEDYLFGLNTGMSFGFEGFANTSSTGSCNSSALVRNDFYGKRAAPIGGSCALGYGNCEHHYAADLLGNKCVQPNSTGTFTIDPYCSTNTYVFTPSPVSQSGSSVTLVPNSYVMTVTDASNCSYTSNIYIGEPSLSVTAISPCVTPPSGTTGLVLSITNGAPITDYRINGGAWQTYTPPLSPIVGIGSHTVEIRDANGCIASDVINVGNLFTASMLVSPTCFNPTATLTVNTVPSPLIGPISYDYNPGPTLTTNTHTITSGGPYGVTVIDPFNSVCNQVATTTAYAQPNININVPSGSCPKTLTANVTPSDPNYLYSWNGNTPSSSNQFVANVSGFYTVVVNNDSCSSSETVPVICNPCFTSTQLANASHIIPDGTLASQLPPLNIVTTQNVIIEKDFIIDVPFNFINCPNILLGPDANIIVQAGNLVTFDNCNLRAGCNEMWNGFTANGVTTLGAGIRLINSTLSDMEFGVQSIAGSNLNITGCQFIDNYRSIYLQNADQQFTIGNNRCVIHSNTFTSTGNPLLPPYSGQSKSEFGVYLVSCENADIGNFGGSTGNLFTNLYNGVYVRPDYAGYAENYNIKYNTFTHINDDLTAVCTYGNDCDIYNNLFQTHRGAAIYCPSGIHAMTNMHYINIAGSGDLDYFAHCDKAVTTMGINTHINYTIVQDCVFGHIMAQTDGHDYNVTSNTLQEVFMGIHLNGNTSTGTILGNGVDCRVGHIQLAPSWIAPPLGIQLQHYFPDPNNQVRVMENNINLNDIEGDGILIQSAGPRVYVGFNSISLASTSTANTDHWIRGISTVRSEGPVIEENTIYGQNNFLSLLYPTPMQNRLSSALFAYQSPDMTLRCNQMDNTHEGFQIMGDCYTGANRVSSNAFHDHVVPMHFKEAIIGLEGTVGDIGTLTDNNDNSFSTGTNPSFPAPHNNLGQFGNAVKVYRTTSTSSIPVNERIFFDPAIIPTQVLPNESWSTVGNTNMYVPSQNNFGPNYPQACISQFFPAYSAPEGRDSIEGDEEIPVAVDSVQYYQFAEVAEWMEENRLYRQLDKDPATRNAFSEYSSFYTSESNEPTKQIWEADKALIALSDSSTMADSALWNQKYQQALTATHLISSSKSYEMNEKKVNTVYLKMLRYGLDSLSQNDKNTIQSLAESCPFVAGNAVYKARMLNANIMPGRFYDNKKICNAVGVYKNGNPSDKLDEIFKKGMGRYGNEALGSIELFPNPNQGHLQVKYELASQGTLIFYDMLGREMKRFALDENLNLTHYSLKLTKGVYLWKCKTAKGIVNTGKLIMD